jgi:hypothetical protein
MRSFLMIMLVLAGVGANISVASAQQADTCKQCSDQRRHCMANYPGKTCTTEYDICMKHCRK